MGNCCSCMTVVYDFEFENRADVVEYRVQIDSNIIWSGKSSKEFTKQIPELIYAYEKELNYQFLNGYTPQLLIERFYGEIIPESKRKPPRKGKPSRGPTNNVDAFVVTFSPCWHVGLNKNILIYAISCYEGSPRKVVLVHDKTVNLSVLACKPTIEFLQSKHF